MIPKPLNLVRQRHDCGCFIGCLAILTGSSYDDAFKLLHPNRSNNGEYYSLQEIGLLPTDAVAKMDSIGLRPRQIKFRSISRLNRTTLLIVRWRHAKYLAHGVIYDAISNSLLDPDKERPNKVEYYEKSPGEVYDAYVFDVPVLPHIVKPSIVPREIDRSLYDSDYYYSNSYCW